MKKYLINIMAIIALAGLSGCEFPDGHSTTSKVDKAEIVEAGSTVKVYPGDTVTPLDASTQVEVDQVYADGYSSVTVVSGSVEITRG